MILDHYLLLILELVVYFVKQSDIPNKHAIQLALAGCEIRAREMVGYYYELLVYSDVGVQKHL